MFSFFEEYVKHSALNFGQAAQGFRFLLTHPDADSLARPGTVRHAVAALPIRAKRIANDLFFAVIPPHWHHTDRELKSLHGYSVKQWFDAGYGPYRFTETGEYLPAHEITREPRWDPRCKE